MVFDRGSAEPQGSVSDSQGFRWWLVKIYKKTAVIDKNHGKKYLVISDIFDTQLIFDLNTITVLNT